MNKFEKVSCDQYIKDCMGDKAVTFDEMTAIIEEYNDIKLPKRATKNSAGYDFFIPADLKLEVGQTVKIPTGIKVYLDEDKVLLIAPRSSLGFKYRIQLDNTLGILDADYVDNKSNEGHCFVKITNDGKQGKTLELKKGDAFAQGIIIQYFKAVDDDSNANRVGGIGSTNCK